MVPGPLNGKDSKPVETKPAEQEFRQALEKAAASGEDKQLKEAANQFEALFIYRMLSQMRQTVVKGGLFEESFGENLFRDMLDHEISQKAAESGQLGLADLIYQQLKKK
jgi:flagellar protein FlgJ